MFCAIALGALWHPLGVVHFLVCATRVLQWDSKKLQKQFKTNGLEHFGGILLGRLTWTIWTTDAFPCSVRLVFHFCEAFSCSAALIFIDEIAFPCRRRSICTRSAPSGGSELSCLDGSVWTGLSGSGLPGSGLLGSGVSGSCLSGSGVPGSGLSGSCLSGSGLSGSCLSGSCLSGFRLSGSGLSGSLQSPLPRPPSHHPPRSPPLTPIRICGVLHIYICILAGTCRLQRQS